MQMTARARRALLSRGEREHTLCAYRCCCTPIAVAAPCRALASGLEAENEGRSEERVFAFIARCILSFETNTVKLQRGTMKVKKNGSNLESSFTIITR